MLSKDALARPDELPKRKHSQSYAMSVNSSTTNIRRLDPALQSHFRYKIYEQEYLYLNDHHLPLCVFYSIGITINGLDTDRYLTDGDTRILQLLHSLIVHRSKFELQEGLKAEVHFHPAIGGPAYFLLTIVLCYLEHFATDELLCGRQQPQTIPGPSWSPSPAQAASKTRAEI
jgi:hypothetical protein